MDAASAAAVVRNRARAARASGVSIVADAGSPTTTDAPESRITYSSSAGGCETASGTATPPARQMPRCTAAYAKLGGTKKRDARLVQVGVVAEQRAGDAPRRVIELVVRERAVGGNDGGAGFTHLVCGRTVY